MEKRLVIMCGLVWHESWKERAKPESKAVQKQDDDHDDDGLCSKMDDGETGTKSQSCMLTFLLISWKRKGTPEEEANSQSH